MRDFLKSLFTSRAMGDGFWDGPESAIIMVGCLFTAAAGGLFIAALVGLYKVLHH